MIDTTGIDTTGYILNNPLILLFITGLVSGVVSSVPLGPTNLWLVNSVLPPQKKISEQFFFVSAITFMDVLYALLALWGYYHFLQGTTLSFFIILFSAIVIIGLGVMDLRKIFFLTEDYATVKSSNLGSFVLGIVMGCNPGFILYWLMVAKTVEKFGVDSINLFYGAVFSCGLIIADVVWYFLVVKASKLYSTFISGNILKFTRAVLACCLIFFGLLMLWDMKIISESII